MRGGTDLGGVNQAFRTHSFGECDQFRLGALEEFFAAVVVAPMPWWRVDHHMATSVQVDVARGALAAGRHPHRVGFGCFREHRGDIGVAVQAGGDDMIEPSRSNVCQVGLADQAPIGDERDASDTETGLEFGHHGGHRGRVLGVAVEHPMRDRDPVTGDQQPDHHLRPIRTVITRVTEPFGGESAVGIDAGGLEVGRRQVVATPAQLEVHQRRQPSEQMRLGIGDQISDRVDGPVALIDRRGHHIGGEFHVTVDPLDDRSTLRRRSQQTVRDHHEHRVGQATRAAPTADAVEVLVKTETFEHTADRGDRPEPRRRSGVEISGVQPGAIGVVLEGSDDAIQLARLA